MQIKMEIENVNMYVFNLKHNTVTYSDCYSIIEMRERVFYCATTQLRTGGADRMSHRKWRESKQQPSRAR